MVAMVFRLVCKVLLGCKVIDMVFRMVSRVLLRCSAWFLCVLHCFKGVLNGM